ncbi:hypothetical protein RJT34_16838 [Clitoria ternatea]|uniref:Uncharacterized protein n=1 Tax=Clitoria ternatea TaxID=43366 RepID=A0AAN9J7T9_CLITE
MMLSKMYTFGSFSVNGLRLFAYKFLTRAILKSAVAAIAVVVADSEEVSISIESVGLEVVEGVDEDATAQVEMA